MEVFVVISVLGLAGLLFYFRYTDARNVTLHALKNYLNQAEKHVENMLKKKEKEFEDKIISAEIVIERMNRLSISLQDKVVLFDEDLAQGQGLFDALKQEISLIAEDLFAYKQIRTDFRDIEEKIGSIVHLKNQAEQGALELNNLKESVKQFSAEYLTFNEEIKFQSKSELEKFASLMQSDLSQYLTKARQELLQKENEMASKMEDITNFSCLMTDNMKEFQEHIQVNLDQLRKDCDNDLEMARTIAQSNLTEVYDMWTKLREDSQKDKDEIQSNLENQEAFFYQAQESLHIEISSFRDSLEQLSKDVQEHVEFSMQDKLRDLDSKIQDLFINIEQKGADVKHEIGQDLTQQVFSVREELDRLYSAFVSQEHAIEEKVAMLGNKVDQELLAAENNFQLNINNLTVQVEETKTYAQDILTFSKGKIEEKISQFENLFREKAEGDILRIEESFREANKERMMQSINHITETLDIEYKQKYQDHVASIFEEARKLEELVNSKFKHVDNLESRYLEISNLFNHERDKILLMVGELEKDREETTQKVLNKVNEYTDHLQQELNNSVQQFFIEYSEGFERDQNLWKERYDEIVQETRNEYTVMKHDINQINHFVSEIETTSLTGLRHEANRITQDTEHRLDDLKRYFLDHLKGSKEDFQFQIEHAKQEIKNLKQELWNQEKEVRQMAQKDFDRLSIKVKDIDKQFQTFMKKSERLDKAEDLMHRFNQRYVEISDLKKDIMQVSSMLKDSCDKGDDTIKNLYVVREELEQKVIHLKDCFSEANRVQEFLLTSVNEANSITDIFSSLQEERIKAEGIEELLLKNLEVFHELQDSLNQLEDRKKLVEDMINSISLSENNLSILSSSGEEMVSKIKDLSSYINQIEDKMKSLQAEMKDLAGDQTKVRMAVSKINDLEHIVLHIDEEMKRLEKMRDWIAKAMTNIERAGKSAGYSKNESEDLEDANVKNILRLYDKSWSIADIAKNLKLSNAFIELILERYRA